MRGKYSTRQSVRAIFHVVHEGIRYFNWFIVLTFKFYDGGWRDMAFLLKDRSRIDVESTVSCCSLLEPVLLCFRVSMLQAMVLYLKLHCSAQGLTGS